MDNWKSQYAKTKYRGAPPRHVLNSRIFHILHPGFDKEIAFCNYRTRLDMGTLQEDAPSRICETCRRLKSNAVGLSDGQSDK